MENWPILSHQELQSLNKTTLTLHMAVQFIAVASKTLIPEESDYSHLSMDWEMEKSYLIGKQLPAKQHLHLALDVSHFSLLIVDELHHIFHRLPLDGQTFSSGIQWLRAQLTKYAVDGRELALSFENDIPDHPTRQGKAFIAPSLGELATFIKVRKIGQKVIKHFADQYPTATAVQTWPHHFDIGTYIPLKQNEAGTTHSISLGMGIKDAYVDEYYFYVTHWAEGGITQGVLPPLASGGYWNQKDFVGANLKLSDVFNQHQKDIEQWQAIQLFIKTAIDASKQRLGI